MRKCTVLILVLLLIVLGIILFGAKPAFGTPQMLLGVNTQVWQGNSPELLNNSRIGTPSVNVELIIYIYSLKYGVDYELALYLAKLESTKDLNPFAENPNSTAKGIYQWLDSSWEEVCEGNVFNAKDNVECAMREISSNGLGRWIIDKSIARSLRLAGFIN